MSWVMGVSGAKFLLAGPSVVQERDSIPVYHGVHSQMDLLKTLLYLVLVVGKNL